MPVSLSEKIWLNDLFSLVYPDLCAACEQPLVKGEALICQHCKHALPLTNYHLEVDNNLEKHFWGRVKVEHAAALYFFSKTSRVQHLVHQLKYKGKREVGERLGQWYGNILKDAPFYNDINIIVPVPLHKEKEYKRGYNQSAVFASGIAKGMKKMMVKDAMERAVFTETQTRKTRIQRWENVETVFQVKKPELLKGKNILLVDDVITTGATIEACVQPLQDIPGAKIYIATLAIAHDF